MFYKQKTKLAYGIKVIEVTPDKLLDITLPVPPAEVQSEIVVVARSGVSAGFVSYWNQPIFLTDGFGYEEKDGLITTKYLYYALKNIEATLNSMKRGAGAPHVSEEAPGKILLSLPSINEQDRIITVLDKFYGHCNDLRTSDFRQRLKLKRSYKNIIGTSY